MEDSHSQQLGEMQQIHQAEVVELKSKHATEVSLLNDIVRKAKHWFPMLEARLQMENLCRKIGFTVEQIGVLLAGKALNFRVRSILRNTKESSMWRMLKSKCSLISPSRTNYSCISTDSLLSNGSRSNGIT